MSTWKQKSKCEEDKNDTDEQTLQLGENVPNLNKSKDTTLWVGGKHRLMGIFQPLDEWKPPFSFCNRAKWL